MRIYTVFNFHWNRYKRLILRYFLNFPTAQSIGKSSVRVYTFIHSALFLPMNPYSLILEDFLTYLQHKTRTTGLF